MAINFADVLNQTVDSIERPPLPPLGTYTWQITAVPKMDTRGDFDIVDFQCRAVAALEDVDSDDLSAYGPVKNVSVRMSFLFDKTDETKFAQSLHRLRTFLEHHIKVPYEGVALKEALNSTVNQQFNGTLRYRADKENPEIQYPEMGKTAPLE